MKIGLLSGAYKNAGDFLIEQRCKLLLEKFMDGSEVHILKRNISYDDRIEELNKFDLMVLGGGPAYRKNLYPNVVPFISELNLLKIPIFIMGCGWDGKDVLNKTIYNFKLSDKTKQFIRYIVDMGGYADAGIGIQSVL